MDLSRSGDLSLFVSGAVDIEGLKRWDWLRWEEEALDKGRINEISCSPTVYEGGGDNGSHSVL